MKSVLVIYYSQSGQLERIAKKIAQPLLDTAEISVTFHEIQPVKPFPFPWDKESFFDAFPESFLQIPADLKPIPIEITSVKYDLILLHYQVWYLSPSIPINSFLKSTEAKKIFYNTPVVTINGSRNMWVMAQEKVKSLLLYNNAILVGNIALVDRAPNLISVITIVEWLFSGVKKKYLGIFPFPGVSEKDINQASKFGDIIQMHLLNNSLQQLQSQLISNHAVRISSYLVSVDKTANKLFLTWAKQIISKKKSRKTWLKAFNLYLLLAIWLISPIVYILHVFKYPFIKSKIEKETKYYKGV